MAWAKSAVVDTIYKNLLLLDPSSETVLVNQDVKIGFKQLNENTSAVWTLSGNILLNSNRFNSELDVSDPWLLSVIAHELIHIRQGWELAFSVFGELEAWQHGFGLYYRKIGKEYPNNLAEIMKIPLLAERRNMIRTRELMKLFAGPKYKIELYPLIPPRLYLRSFIRKIFDHPNI